MKVDALSLDKVIKRRESVRQYRSRNLDRVREYNKQHAKEYRQRTNAKRGVTNLNLSIRNAAKFGVFSPSLVADIIGIKRYNFLRLQKRGVVPFDNKVEKGYTALQVALLLIATQDFRLLTYPSYRHAEFDVNGIKAFLDKYWDDPKAFLEKELRDGRETSHRKS
jgi:hypothetical protein